MKLFDIKDKTHILITIIHREKDENEKKTHKKTTLFIKLKLSVVIFKQFKLWQF